MWLQFLTYGSIGVGLAIALLAARLFHANRLDGGTRLMTFGFALVLIGAALEVTRAWQAYYTNQRLIAATANLPDEFFSDFLNTRVGKATHLAEPTDEYFRDYLDVDSSANLTVRLGRNQCKYFFAAAKPPSKVQVIVKDADIDESGVGYNSYYEVGKVCNSKNAVKDVVLELRLKESGGQSQLAAYNAPPLIDTVAAAPPNNPDEAKPAKEPERSPAQSSDYPRVSHRLCIGQFEENCAGPHDIFRACGTFQSEEQVAQEVCGKHPTKISRLNTRSGNACGYALTDILCN